MKILISILIALSSSFAFAAENKCSYQVLESGGQYDGCITTIDGHSQTFSKKDMTRFGCEETCSSGSPEDKNKDIPERHRSRTGGTCKAEEVYSYGKYIKCRVNNDGTTTFIETPLDACRSYCENHSNVGKANPNPPPDISGSKPKAGK